MNFLYLGLALFDGALALSYLLKLVAVYMGRKTWAYPSGGFWSILWLSVFATLAVFFGSLVTA